MNISPSPWSAKRGFTFVELLVTLSLLALLASVVLPISDLLSRQQKEQELRHALLEIRQALDQFKEESAKGKIPPSLQSVDGYPLQLTTLLAVTEPNSKAPPIHFLRRIPRDPFFPDNTVKPEDTWGKRSYNANLIIDPSQPAGDIYDIYSLSNQIGTNGIAYKEW
ncbi:prepilin-type N-terminal cleavage/methylation domain-containing protein [Aquirhabdus parva]|uniref:Prepilin-type N-terminal cleavage/methylation domain-containing protein n=1 Tax=Aquirhabdus parva TaxID=2283318 RepID=A0A345P2H4_9GAMM|nr:prepilin-type N-terminal cleavage/methylation domain-containing protein [Aquirhabdus parva]AXI01483.1 prepilin-type N-terminal cleavage/methylation domain-containing protein [Aquirhabdus parva]